MTTSSKTSDPVARDSENEERKLKANEEMIVSTTDQVRQKSARMSSQIQWGRVNDN